MSQDRPPASSLKFKFGAANSTSSSSSLTDPAKRSLTKISSVPMGNSSSSHLNSPGTKLPVIKRSGTYVVDEAGAASQPNAARVQKNATHSNIGGPATPVRPVITSANNDLRVKVGPGLPTAKVSPISKVVVSNRSSNLAAFKQQKRAEMAKMATSENQYFARVPLNSDESPSVLTNNVRSLNKLLKNAQKTGILNLSSYDLEEVPASVWRLNIDKIEEDDAKKNNISFESSPGQENWWETVELTKLLLVSNKIKAIPSDVQHLNSLVSLDVHDNQLESVDEAIGQLSLLQNLNLSFNQLTTLPNNICKLKRLVHLNVSNNKLNQLPNNIGHLDELDDLNLSNNSLTKIPKSFGWLLKLRKLNLSSNELTNLIPEMFYSTNLIILDISENKIECLIKEIGELGHLEQLFTSRNKLTKFPVLEKCCKLKDLDVSFNQLTELDENFFANLMMLVNFNLRDNQLKELPRTIEQLQSLERLDVTNNNLTSLPYELAKIESLKQILLTGNPIRSIRKDIVNRGADAILKHLKNHLRESQMSEEGANPAHDLVKSELIKSSKVYDVSCKKLEAITPEMIEFCKKCTALSMNANKNLLKDLPPETEALSNQLNELVLSNNHFSVFPAVICKFRCLSSLDLRGNKLTSVPDEIASVKSLRELLLGNNRFEAIPDGVYELPILENLFMNDNKLKAIDALRLLKMKHLSTLNLQNNDLTQIPPELGKSTSLRSLQLEGNQLRLIRTQILAKGTASILEYLRSRLVEAGEPAH